MLQIMISEGHHMFNNRLRNQALDLTRTLGLFVTVVTGGEDEI